jgi:pimeloyl-ACP methyl ester carboxylesterase
MPLINIGNLNLNVIEHGDGETIVVFIHGNLGCADWLDLVWDKLPGNIRVVAIEWRGCGGSDRPEADPDYANYSMRRHAEDMLAAIDTLGIRHCHLAIHSTGGIISTHMLLMEPERFGRVLALDPIGPMGLRFEPEQEAVFAQMRDDHGFARALFVTAMPTLFTPESLRPGAEPVFADRASADQRALFERLVDNARKVSDGILFGTPRNLTREWDDGTLRAKQETISHTHLLLWGEQDYWIPREHVEEMADRMPNCRLVVVPDVGHSMNVERPELYARHFADFFAG